MSRMSKTIYYGGPVVAAAGEVPPDCAVLVEDGVIRAVGERSSLLGGCGADVRRADLGGRALIPAFIDAHSHITSLAAAMGSADLTGAEDIGGIQRRLRAFLARDPPAAGAWATATGYDPGTLAEGRHPSRAELDAVSDQTPIVAAHASGHMGVVNTAALRLLGVSGGTPDPPGGRIGRDARGEPDGYLEEAAFTAAAARIPPPPRARLLRRLEQAQEVYLRRGIATIQDGFTRRGDYELLAEAAARGMLKADVVCYAGLEEAGELIAENRARAGRYQDRLKLGGYKIFLDGSPQGRTAWMTRPYRGAADGYRGYPLHTDEEVAGFLKRALREGVQLLAHCNGDAAAAQFIAAYGAARRALPGAPDIRPVMIHAQLLRRDQLAEMARLGMAVSFFAAHTWRWGDAHLHNFGRARAAFISPARSALAAGVPFTFHQDAPVLEPDMLFTLWCAMNRVTRGGERLAASERVTAGQALAAVTATAAWQYFEEGEKGRIAPGLRADFAVLERDPLAVPPEEVKNIRVLATIKDGEAVYTA